MKKLSWLYLYFVLLFCHEYTNMSYMLKTTHFLSYILFKININN